MIFSFTEYDKVLFVGEGNFSFSASLVKFLADQNICRNLSYVTVSCYEASDPGSEGEKSARMEAGGGGQGDTSIETGGGDHRNACLKFGGGRQENACMRAGAGGQSRACVDPDGGGQRRACTEDGGGWQRSGATRELLERRANMEFLKSRGCSILEGLDGQKLHEDERLGDCGFTLVVFMFPHIGGKMKIGRNRALLLGFLKSCMQVLSPDGRVLVTLARGQGGSPLERQARAWADTWQVVEQGHEADFVLSQVEFLDLTPFPSYSRVGYRSLQKGFTVDDSIVHCFRPARMPDIQPLEACEEKNLHPVENPPYPSCHHSIYPPSYTHHLSFWLPLSPSPGFPLEEELTNLITSLMAQGCVKVSVKVIGSYQKEGRSSLTLELEYRSQVWALGVSRAWHLHYNILGQTLVNLFNVHLR